MPRQFVALIRHGETPKCLTMSKDSSQDYYDVHGKDEEIELTDKGRCQAREAGILLKSLFPRRGRRLKRLYTGQFKRVRQTGDEIASTLPYQISRTVDVRLNKRSYGEFWNITAAGIKRLYPKEYELLQKQGEFLYTPPNGENYPVFNQRVDNFRAEVIDACSDNIVIAGHLAVMLRLTQGFLNISDERVLEMYKEMFFPNGYVVLFVRENQNSPWLFHPLPPPD